MALVYKINDKIRIISFLCTVMVLFRHSRNLMAFWSSESVNNYTAYIETTISVFTEIAVPSFFIISGYFFFKYDYYDNNNYIRMIKKKLKTLVIPFIFWNIIGAVILLIYDPSKIGDSIQTCLYNMLLSKWNSPLWYVRDLILIMIIAPVYAWIFKIDNKFLYLILFLILFFRWWPIDSTVLSTEGQLFFFIGGIIRKHKYVLENIMPVKIFIFLLTIWLLYSLNMESFYDKNLHRLNTIIGIMVFWRLIDFINCKRFDFLYRISSYSFFIYVMHTYIIKLIKREIANTFYGNSLMALLTYFVVPVFTIVVILLIAKYWKRYSEKTYLTVTGGR